MNGATKKRILAMVHPYPKNDYNSDELKGYYACSDEFIRAFDVLIDKSNLEQSGKPPKQNWNEIEEEFDKEFTSNGGVLPKHRDFGQRLRRDLLDFFKQKFQQNLHEEAIEELN